MTSEGGDIPLGDGNVDDVSKNDEVNGTDCRGVAFGDVEGGRPPSSIGQETFRWHDVLEEMTTEERRGLILSAIHPPYPFESDTEGGAAHGDCEPDDAHLDAVVCGALKEVGETHLWEQTRHYYPGGDVDEGTSQGGEEQAVPDIYDAEGRMTGELYGASEARASFRSQERSRRRKRAMSRATKERLGRRIVSIKEHSASYAKAAACSKVRWTEDDFAHLRRENTESGPSCADSTLPPQGERSERPRRWLEMDLGECTIEMVDGEERMKPGRVGGGENGERSKRFLAFRSLEVALIN
ncbi:hypothetical protein ACHAW5_000012 [Stephanodiscus triporus]|uniref:Uncharacterized protein n=1 Tax=Stephanodiscus triporus TaxID=2934178 RepID=A0ABD3MWD1_9STRA